MGYKAPTLICIPDISGFTEFMSKVDFELGSRVIPSLLNKIIYSNEIGLKVSEIEGDAVLFYRQGKLPSLENLIQQCQHFHAEFYKHLNLLRKEYSTNENASAIPEILGLKIILHFGKEIALVAIGKHIKLMGEDVIVAHRLLKNAVPHDEYILLSKDLMAVLPRENSDWDPEVIETSNIKDEHMGDISFFYIPFDTGTS